MADTGIVYRRNTKALLILSPPRIGEIVFATDTEEYGALEGGVLVWRAHGSSSELQKVSETNTGWRLLGNTSLTQNNSGLNAVDLSTGLETPSVTGPFGATGDYAFSSGFSTLASGFGAHAEGEGTIAQNQSSHAEGKYNIGTSLDTIHETGIGLSSVARKNAFEIYTDGTITAPEATPALVQARGMQTLVPLSYLFSAEFGNALPTVPFAPGTLYIDVNGFVKVSNVNLAPPPFL